MDINYRERMIGYYPPAIQKIIDFQAIVEGGAPEYEALSKATETITNDAYWLTMGEERIAQWEQKLEIYPSADSTIEDRRAVILARVNGQGKLNTALINKIVRLFTGGTCRSWMEDGQLCIEIDPPKDSHDYKFENLHHELALKVPAHLGFQLTRKYMMWLMVHENNATWDEVNTWYKNWEAVYYDSRTKANQLGITPFGEFLLG